MYNYTLINSYLFFIKIYYILNLQKHKPFKKIFFLLDFSKNDFLVKKNIKTTVLFYSNFFTKASSFRKIMSVISCLFILNKNIIFVDINTNYNYLPISNELLFSRSFKRLDKFIKYFNVTMILYLDLNNKKFVFKKLYNYNLINVSVSSKFSYKKFDLNLNFLNNQIYSYLFYLSVMGLYLKIKNN